jgi:Family of unknown function (DUF6069)
MAHRTRRRISTVVLAPAAALIGWALTQLAGIDLVVSAGDDSIGPADVFAAALVGALAGWLVVLVLEKHGRYPRARWSFVGSTALSVSIVGPVWLADGASSVALIALHVVTAVVVIVGFAGTLPVYRSAGETLAAQQASRRSLRARAETSVSGIRSDDGADRP